MNIQKVLEIEGHAGAVYDIAAKGDFIYSCSADKYVARWSLSSGEQDNFAIKAGNAIYSLAINDVEDELWIGLSNGDIHVISIQTKKELKYFQQHKSAVFSILCLNKRKQIICSDADGNLSIWNATTKKLDIALPLDCGKIRHLQTNEDESLIFLHCQDDKIRVFETTGFNEIITLPGHENGANCSIYLTDSKTLISGGKDGLIKCWDLAKESLEHTYPAHNYAVYDLIDFPERDLYISCSRDKSFKVWNRSSHDFIEKIEIKNGGHRHSVNRLIRLNEHQFASCSDDKKILIWNIQ